MKSGLDIETAKKILKCIEDSSGTPGICVSPSIFDSLGIPEDKLERYIAELKASGLIISEFGTPSDIKSTSILWDFLK